jgi:hypothetical protein
VRQTRISARPAITAGDLQIFSVLLLFSSRQFEKLSSQVSSSFLDLQFDSFSSEFFKFLSYRFLYRFPCRFLYCSSPQFSYKNTILSVVATTPALSFGAPPDLPRRRARRHLNVPGTSSTPNTRTAATASSHHVSQNRSSCFVSATYFFGQQKGGSFGVHCSY